MNSLDNGKFIFDMSMSTVQSSNSEPFPKGFLFYFFFVWFFLTIWSDSDPNLNSWKLISQLGELDYDKTFKLGFSEPVFSK